MRLAMESNSMAPYQFAGETKGSSKARRPQAISIAAANVRDRPSVPLQRYKDLHQRLPGTGAPPQCWSKAATETAKLSAENCSSPVASVKSAPAPVRHARVQAPDDRNDESVRRWSGPAQNENRSAE